MGLDGGGMVGRGVEMQSEAVTGRRWERSKAGARLAGGEDAREDTLEMSEDGVPSDEPRGIFAAQA
jgi:hypothetical protein